MARRKELQERIEEMEAELATKSKENVELCQKIKLNNDMLSELSRPQNIASNEDNSDQLKYQIEELAELLAQETEIRKQLEAAVAFKETQCNEMREILTVSIDCGQHVPTELFEVGHVCVVFLRQTRDY